MKQFFTIFTPTGIIHHNKLDLSKGNIDYKNVYSPIKCYVCPKPATEFYLDFNKCVVFTCKQHDKDIVISKRKH